ncbi:C40 family peptidase [Vagococcus elongatus]|uniref:NlpC/P60 domain-containing protein n=1 Tax=Vagococcus elongatus TaxID=180344 RepID=A0A430B1E0_9ENTE|nr:C40 family peptidase [Vagococcus elongatus]RSU14042.1 hypothetical protein CBF29_03930 [Vagococcus elongatus]
MKKKILSVLLVSGLALGSVTIPATVNADEVNNKIEASDKKINELANQAAAAEAQLATLRANMDSIRAKAEKLQTEQIALNGELTTLNEEIAALTVKIEKRDGKIKEQARAIQTGEASSNYLEAVLSAETISDAVTRVAATARLVAANNDLLKEQEKDKAAVETKAADAETKLETIEKNAGELEQQKGALIEQEYQQTILVSTIEAEKTSEEGKKSELLAEKEAAERALEEQARQVEAAQQAAQQQAAQPAPESAGNAQSGGNGVVNPPNNGGGGGAAAPSPVIPDPVPTPTTNAGAILAEAAKHVGKPYVWAAKGPDSFDCSGFTSYVFRVAAGREIGGYTGAQEGQGVRISLSQVQAGDLLFWGPQGGSTHVAISTGGSGYIHAPAPGQTVCYSNFAWYAPSFAVRVL